MEDEFEVFMLDPFLDNEEIDPDYEFDAPRFCDFSQPETYWDAAEAEQWFESAESYPPSRKHSKNTMFSGSDQTSSSEFHEKLVLFAMNGAVKLSLDMGMSFLVKSREQSHELVENLHYKVLIDSAESFGFGFHFAWFEMLRVAFVLKLRWGKAIPLEIVYTSADYRDGKSSDIVDDYSGCCMEHEVSAEDDDSRGLEFYNSTSKGKTKSLSKSARLKGSTLMNPTASHLAKQRNPPEVPTTPPIFSRSQSQISSSTDGKETKRQKLEAGFLRKTSNLKHQAPSTHKTPKKLQVDLTDVNSASRPKVTIPRQFDLETAHRAQRHKSRANTESGGRTKSSSHTFKALPLNKKILETPSLPSRKKRTPQLTEFLEFHLKTSERAMQHTSSYFGRTSNCSSSSSRETRDFRRQNSTDATRQEKCRLANKLRSSPDNKRLSSKGERSVFRNIKQENIMELKFTNDKRFLNEPPTELFSKLSLASEVKQTTKSQSKEEPTSKGLKENRPGYFHLEHEDELGQRRNAETLSEAVSVYE